MNIYLVLHHEIMGVKENCRADEMVFYTATSFENAMRLIKKTHVSAWSWWEIQVHDANTSDWPESLGLYGRRGGKLRKSYDEFVAIYEKEGLNRN